MGLRPLKPLFQTSLQKNIRRLLRAFFCTEGGGLDARGSRPLEPFACNFLLQAFSLGTARCILDCFQQVMVQEASPPGLLGRRLLSSAFLFKSCRALFVVFNSQVVLFSKRKVPNGTFLYKICRVSSAGYFLCLPFLRRTPHLSLISSSIFLSS